MKWHSFGILTALTLLCTLLFLPEKIEAGGCYRYSSYSYSPSYSSYSSSYVAPVAKSYVSYDYIQLVTPVLPVYTLPAAYGALYYPPVAGLAAAYGGGYAGAYNGAAGAYGAPATNGAVAYDSCAETKAELKVMKERMSWLERLAFGQLPGMQGANPQSSQPSPTQSQKQPDPVKQPDPMMKASNGSSSADFLNLATTYCASCHNTATVSKEKGGGFTLTDNNALAKLTPQQVGEVIRRVTLPDGDKDQMPKGKQMPSQARVEFVAKFIASLPQ
jgi:hypothetical protein